MTLTEMTIISSTPDGLCPLCHDDVPPAGFHLCMGANVMHHKNFLQQPPRPSYLEDEILATLKEIKGELEAIKILCQKL